MGERPPFTIRRLQPGDAEALAGFYNGLSREAIRTFRPLGVSTTVDACAKIVLANGAGVETRFDLIAFDGARIVGWSFLWDLDTEKPLFGLATADDQRRKGLGGELMDRVMAIVRERGLARVFLTVVKDNDAAWRMYEKRGFAKQDEFVQKGDGLTYFRMTWCRGG
jgi:ribosomal protein S18 acetylase RimI-like enzyme